jgi:signal transduction histidine kinase
VRLSSAVDSLDWALRQLRTAIFVAKDPRPLDDRAGSFLTLVTIVDEAGRMFATPPTVSIDRTVDDERWRPLHNDLVAALRECLSNVARHACASSVAVSVTCTNERLELVVNDDGIGIPVERSRAGNGLGNLATRSAHHGGNVRDRTASQ